MTEYVGYVYILCGTGGCLCDPTKISNIREVGEEVDERTGLRVIHSRYDYQYDRQFRQKMTHDVFVPAERGYDFAEEVRLALEERAQPDWVDPV